MFCPSCESEYRPGFTRCASCDVDLVPDLRGAAESHDAPPAPVRHLRQQADSPDPGLIHAVNLLGFLTLDDARDAREQLRARGVRSEILIRDSQDPEAEDGEEYWIRVAPQSVKASAAILGDEPEVEVQEAEEILCSACNKPVDEDAAQCPHCGARFEEA